MNDKDALQRAIETLGAIEVAPGRYAYQSGIKEPQAWRVTTDELVCEYGEARLRHGVLMPAWWTPEQRFAVIATNGKTCPAPTRELAKAANVGALIVTASSETGEEVVA